MYYYGYDLPFNFTLIDEYPDSWDFVIYIKHFKSHTNLTQLLYIPTLLLCIFWHGTYWKLLDQNINNENEMEFTVLCR